MKTKIITLLVGLATLTPISSWAYNNTASTQAVASLSASCIISAKNLSFGSVSLPLSSQSASTDMSVLCSANAPYTIGLAYGGVYGTSQNVTAPYNNTGVYKYIQGGQALYWVCTYTASGPNGQTQTNTTTSATGQCPATNQSYTFSSAYAYGKMIGVAKGDSIGYSIAVPNSPGQVWNTGNASYSATGTGATQSISVVGTLVPGQSGSSYPTPDSYMDTVTATINF